MKRREFLLSGAIGGGVVALQAGRAAAQAPSGGETLYVNPGTGADVNSGAQGTPLRSLAEAARRVSRAKGVGPMTVILSEGVYAVEETALFRPEGRTFTKTDRLTIRAEVLPDDPAWHWGRMPTLMHTLPVLPTWNGNSDPLGGAVDGMLIETSHVSILGLRILGLPVVESPQAGQIKRLYGISRLNRSLEDLEIGHCLFAGDLNTTPFHVGIIANGNSMNVHHSIFRGLKISVVYWSGGSTGHAMTNCVCEDLYGSAVWTSSIADDFVFRNNVVANCNYAWTWQPASSADADRGGGSRPALTPEQAKTLADARANPKNDNHYKVVDSYFSRNHRLAGSGTGARLGYKDIDGGFLEMVRTKSTEQDVTFELDQSKLTYLHPVAGSPAAALGAGLFLKPRTTG